MKKTILATITAMVVLAVAITGVYAAPGDFTPSVTAKLAPEVIEVISAQGARVAAVIRNMATSESVGVPAASGLALVPVSDAIKAPAEGASEVVKDLAEAYKEISQAKGLESIGVDFTSALKAAGSSAKPQELVVRDLVGVDLGKEFAELLKIDGNELEVTFNLGVKKNDLVLVVIRSATSGWKLIDSKNVKNNGDGTVSLILDEQAPVSFVTISETKTAESKIPFSPSTGDIAFAAVAIAITAAIAAAVISRKKHAGRA